MGQEIKASEGGNGEGVWHDNILSSILVQNDALYIFQGERLHMAHGFPWNQTSVAILWAPVDF